LKDFSVRFRFRQCVHVVKTNVPDLRFSPSTKTITARGYPGNTDYSIQLSNGHQYSLNAKTSAGSHLSGPTVLGPWNLTVEDWQPGPGPKKNYTSVFTYHSIILNSTLIPWYNISGLENTSGIGVYTTNFSWPPSLPQNNNASATSDIAGSYLSLHRPIFHTARIHINGQQTSPLDVDDPVTDISPFLTNGMNAVRIDVSSTLRNRLLVFNNTQSWEQSQYSGSYGP
jgi:hypothetical protein